jgi:hypothetical protein
LSVFRAALAGLCAVLLTTVGCGPATPAAGSSQPAQTPLQAVELIPARIDAYLPRVTPELAVPLPAACLIPTAQLGGLMVATALEPASMHGLLVYPGFAGLAAIGPYPVSRVPAGAASSPSACGRND